MAYSNARDNGQDFWERGNSGKEKGMGRFTLRHGGSQMYQDIVRGSRSHGKHGLERVKICKPVGIKL